MAKFQKKLWNVTKRKYGEDIMSHLGNVDVCLRPEWSVWAMFHRVNMDLNDWQGCPEIHSTLKIETESLQLLKLDYFLIWTHWIWTKLARGLNLRWTLSYSLVSSLLTEFCMNPRGACTTYKCHSWSKCQALSSLIIDSFLFNYTFELLKKRNPKTRFHHSLNLITLAYLLEPKLGI